MLALSVAKLKIYHFIPASQQMFDIFEQLNLSMRISLNENNFNITVETQIPLKIEPDNIIIETGT